MPRAVHRLALLLSTLAMLALAGCGSGAGQTTAAPATQRRAVSASPQPAASPLVIRPSSSPAAGTAAQAGPGLAAPSLRLPSDGHQVVVVDSTEGQGVWVRRQPGGEPMRVWPDGSPMLIVGEDQFASGRVWRKVSTLDGLTGWVAAEYVLPADPALVAAGLASLGPFPAAPAGTPAARPADLQARVTVGDGASAANEVVTAPTATPRAVARPTRTGAAYIGQPAAPAVTAAAGPTATPASTATPMPTATPIKAPAGARSIDAGPATLAVAAAERGLPIQVGNRPRAGMELLAVQVTVTNRDDEPFALYRGSFRLALSDRTRVEPLAGGQAPMPYSMALAPGEQFEGWLTFEVPVGTRVDGLIWAPERDTAYSLSVQP